MYKHKHKVSYFDGFGVKQISKKNIKKNIGDLNVFPNMYITQRYESISYEYVSVTFNEYMCSNNTASPEKKIKLTSMFSSSYFM